MGEGRRDASGEAGGRGDQEGDCHPLELRTPPSLSQLRTFSPSPFHPSTPISMAVDRIIWMGLVCRMEEVDGC